MRVDVVVRTRKIGHFFPGGTVDAYDTWLELKATDDKGQTIFWSGSVEDNGKGPVEKGAHFYRSLQIDAHGNRHQQTQCLGHPRRRLCAPDSAGRGRHGSLPPSRFPKTAGNKITLARPPVLSQVCLVEHAVLLRRRRRSQPTHADVTPDYDDRKFSFTGIAERRVRERGKNS